MLGQSVAVLPRQRYSVSSNPVNSVDTRNRSCCGQYRAKPRKGLRGRCRDSERTTRPVASFRYSQQCNSRAPGCRHMSAQDIVRPAWKHAELGRNDQAGSYFTAVTKREQASGDILDDKFQDGLEQILVREDNVWLTLAREAAATENDLFYFNTSVGAAA